MTGLVFKTVAAASVAAGALAATPAALAATSSHAIHAPLSSASPSGGQALGQRPGNAMSPKIVGGSTVTNSSVVQLVFGQNGGTYGCTGEVIAPRYVLTAQHCTQGDTWMDVYQSNSVTNRGTAVAADRLWASPYGDVAIVHLSQNAKVPALKMTSSYTPRAGDAGIIEGYGLRANKQQATRLYKANVKVLGQSSDAFGGKAIHVQGVDGASNHGDSGGPLLINGVVVGVCSTGDTADPGSNIHAGSNYANLTGSRSWIRSIAGV